MHDKVAALEKLARGGSAACSRNRQMQTRFCTALLGHSETTKPRSKRNRRASWARQKWMPVPKAMWWFGLPSRSSFSGASCLEELGFDVVGAKGFARIKALADAVDAVYSSDEAKQRFEILARQVFARFKALLMEPTAFAYVERHDNIEATYKKLTERRDTADVTELQLALESPVGGILRRGWASAFSRSGHQLPRVLAIYECTPWLSSSVLWCRQKCLL
jgi:hypothetical protein